MVELRMHMHGLWTVAIRHWLGDLRLIEDSEESVLQTAECAYPEKTATSCSEPLTERSSDPECLPYLCR